LRDFACFAPLREKEIGEAKKGFRAKAQSRKEYAKSKLLLYHAAN
jgi:hypothetical protein